jgi:preprotein translocase subunit SecA
MARLKMREYFMPRIVKPEDEDMFSVHRAAGLPPSSSSAGQGLFLGKKLKLGKLHRKFFQLNFLKKQNSCSNKQ